MKLNRVCLCISIHPIPIARGYGWVIKHGSLDSITHLFFGTKQEHKWSLKAYEKMKLCCSLLSMKLSRVYNRVCSYTFIYKDPNTISSLGIFTIEPEQKLWIFTNKQGWNPSAKSWWRTLCRFPLMLHQIYCTWHNKTWTCFYFS